MRACFQRTSHAKLIPKNKMSLLGAFHTQKKGVSTQQQQHLSDLLEQGRGRNTQVATVELFVICFRFFLCHCIRTLHW